MQARHDLTAACSANRLFAWVDDLSNYPDWMTLVHDVDRLDPIPGDGGVPAWDVELQAKIGPFTRSKRLRMIRTVHQPIRTVVFERCEIDGRQHAPWVLSAHVAEIDAERSSVVMELRYGGSLWTGAVLQRVLDDAVRRGSEALADVVSREPTR